MIKPPPSLMGEVYCFPRRQLIFNFGMRRILFERSLRVHPEIDSVCLYHDLQMNGWHSFLSWIFNVIHQWFRLNKALQTIGKLFSNFKCLRCKILLPAINFASARSIYYYAQSEIFGKHNTNFYDLEILWNLLTYIKHM